MRDRGGVVRDDRGDVRHVLACAAADAAAAPVEHEEGDVVVGELRPHLPQPARVGLQPVEVEDRALGLPARTPQMQREVGSAHGERDDLPAYVLRRPLGLDHRDTPAPPTRSATKSVSFWKGLYLYWVVLPRRRLDSVYAAM